jgi:AcrR family transcriptional regulator
VANKTTQRVEEKKSRILAAAKDILVRKGRQTRMADIAEVAGMETSSLYYYFKGIPEVLNALLYDQYRDLSEFELEAESEGLSNMQALGRIVRYLLEFYHENFELVQITLCHVTPLFQDPELEEDAKAINDFLVACRNADKVMLKFLRGAQGDHEITNDYVPATLLKMLRGAIWGIVASWRTHYPPATAIPGYIDRIFLMIT